MPSFMPCLLDFLGLDLGKERDENERKEKKRKWMRV